MRQPLSHQISDMLTRKIVSGDFPPGTALPSEAALCDQFGVSRPVVREALKMLWAQGLVDTQAGKESVVRALNDDALRLFFDRILKPQERRGLVDLLEVRRQLEMMSARLAASRRTKGDLNDLGRIVRSMEDTLSDADAYSRMDVEFHILLAACSRNSFLYHLTTSIRSSLIGVIKELRLHDYQGSTKEIHAQHCAVFEAVRNGDPDAAENAIGAHYDDVISRLRQSLEERGAT